MDAMISIDSYEALGARLDSMRKLFGATDEKLAVVVKRVQECEHDGSTRDVQLDCLEAMALVMEEMRDRALDLAAVSSLMSKQALLFVQVGRSTPATPVTTTIH